MMLCQAAAEKWGVPLSECNAANGRISHPSGKSESYGALADAASKLPIPTNLQLKARSNWRILGKPTARLDTPLKVDGSAQFGIDVRVPDMLVGTIAASPVFGGKLKSVDDTPALRVKGVRAVVKLGDAVAVLGEGYWPCKKGLEALSPQWEEGPNANLDSERIATMLNDGFGKEGAVAEIQGDPAAALQKATKTVEACANSAAAAMIMPDWQYPHCGTEQPIRIGLAIVGEPAVVGATGRSGKLRIVDRAGKQPEAWIEKGGIDAVGIHVGDPLVRIEPAWLAVLVFHRIGGDDALTRTDRANGADAALAGADRVLRYNEPFPAVFALDDARRPIAEFGIHILIP